MPQVWDTFQVRARTCTILSAIAHGFFAWMILALARIESSFDHGTAGDRQCDAYLTSERPAMRSTKPEDETTEKTSPVDSTTDSGQDGFGVVDDFARFIVKLYLEQCRKQ
jgi:hypothetical protein